MESRKRIPWLDFARVIAISLVVFTHAHENAYIANDMLASVFYSIDRLGVPLFFMISGGLILPRLVNCNYFVFYKKRIPQFLVLLVVWTVITNSFNYFALGKSLIESLGMAISINNGLLNANYGVAQQMWFMYIIVQLYLISPFLAKLLNNSSNKEILIFLCLCIFFNQFKNTISFFGVDVTSINKMGVDFTGPYIVYFIIGYLAIERGMWCKEGWLMVASCLLMIFLPMIPVMAVDYFGNNVRPDLHWYSISLFITVSSTGLLLLLRCIFMKRSNKIISTISMCAFGIYLTHYAFIFVLNGIAFSYLLKLGQIERMVIYFVFSFLCSMTITYFMMKNKITKYFVS